MEGNTCIPIYLKGFLRLNSNKVGLISFLTSAFESKLTIPDDKVLIVTKIQNVVPVPPTNISRIQSCNHEEADDRMVPHMAHGYENEYSRVMVQASDTDVATLAELTTSTFSNC